MILSVIPFMKSDNKIDKVLWDVCSLVNKITDNDDSRLDALKWGLIVLVEKFVTNNNRKRRIFELINMESSYYFELYGKEKVEQGRMEIIQNLLESGLSAEQVSKLAKVPLNRVQSIKF